MSKGILEFNLDDPYDRSAHKRAVSATDAYIAFHDIDNVLRDMLKYDKIIGEGKEIALPEGLHTITHIEAILLNQVVQYIRSKVSRVLEVRNNKYVKWLTYDKTYGTLSLEQLKELSND